MRPDAYVLGSGPSLSYVDPEFFRHKFVIATNGVAERLGLYEFSSPRVLTHGHYHDEIYDLAVKYPGHWFYTPEGDRGFAGSPGRTDLENVFHYRHNPTQYNFDVDNAWHPNGIIVGSTSLHGSMHIACKWGAKNLILVGADCGMIDGQTNQDGYKSGNLNTSDPILWLTRWEYHLRQVKAKLKAEYDVRIYSLNPFLNFNLEGHTWTGSTT